ncbi:MAG: SGNH/GDSL hydrolase family protein [Candidatus Brocadia sp.]|nr:SGNH/GDSL hydrolase family protein [Candidatus Brocadia sp.]
MSDPKSTPCDQIENTVLQNHKLSKSQKLIINLTLLLFIVGSCFTIGEAIIRVLYKDKIVLFPRYHTDAVYGEYQIRRLRPNSVFWHTSVDGSWKFTTNAQGFRDNRDFKYEKPPNTLRILSLGDSHTQGFEVKQECTFSAVTERYLNDYMKHNGFNAETEVINTGVSGFSTAEELVFLENEGIKYKPDFVILAFSANDFEDNIKSDLFCLKEDNLVVKSKKHVPGVRILNKINRFAVLRQLSENSYLYSLVLNSVWDYSKHLLYSKKVGELTTEFVIQKGEANEYEITLTQRLLERMYKFCKDNGIRLIILDIPQVDKEGFKSSIPPQLNEIVKDNCDTFVSNDKSLNDVHDVTKIFVPHGHRHISEFTHLQLGIAVSKEILSYYDNFSISKW